MTGNNFYLVPINPQLKTWICNKIYFKNENKLIFNFINPKNNDLLEIIVSKGETAKFAFLKLSDCFIQYNGKINDLNDRIKEVIRTLIYDIAENINQILKENPDKSILLALRGYVQSASAEFGESFLYSILAPEIIKGKKIIGDWVLTDVYPSSYFGKTNSNLLELILDFRDEILNKIFRILISPKNTYNETYMTTNNFDIKFYGNIDSSPQMQFILSLVVFLLVIRDHEQLTIDFPEAIDYFSKKLLIEDKIEKKEDKILNLAINSECNQTCLFCSAKEISPVFDGGNEELARIKADILSNYQSGVRKIRINGFEPLAFSKIINVFEYINKLNFNTIEIYSTFTLFADYSFCRKILSLISDDKIVKFSIPLYGHDPTLHDRIVGKEGAYELVVKAVENIKSFKKNNFNIFISTVLIKENTTYLKDIINFSKNKLNLPINFHLPFPNYESEYDKYFITAEKESIIASNILKAIKMHKIKFNVIGLHPCILLKDIKNMKLPINDYFIIPDKKPVLKGKEYSDKKYLHRSEKIENDARVSSSLPCPYILECALNTICSTEILQSYVKLYGINEFTPITLKELLN